MRWDATRIFFSSKAHLVILRLIMPLLLALARFKNYGQAGTFIARVKDEDVEVAGMSGTFTRRAETSVADVLLGSDQTPLPSEQGQWAETAQVRFLFQSCTKKQ